MSERIESGRASGARDVASFQRVNSRDAASAVRPVGEQTTRRVADFPQSAPPGAGLVGRTLGGRYTLTRLLGRGGFGAVYHALQAPIERSVAVKVIGGAGHDPADLRRRFVLEARALAHVSAHCNGVGLIELGEEPDGLLYIVQDYIDGRSLDAVLREDGPLEPDRAVSIVCAVLDALDAAHHHGIVHRDVKPSNVMLVNDHRGRERVKLLDFGIAHIVGAVRGGISPTATGVIVGSPQYMAPEQFSGEGISSRVDLYAAGVLLYELLTGSPPFMGTAVELMHHHLSRPPQPIAAERGVSAALEAVIGRALCKSPFGRYGDAVEMRAALEAAMVVEAPAVEGVRRGWGARLGWAASVALAAWVGWMAAGSGSGGVGGDEGRSMMGAASTAHAVAPVSSPLTVAPASPTAAPVSPAAAPVSPAAVPVSPAAVPAPATAAPASPATVPASPATVPASPVTVPAPAPKPAPTASLAPAEAPRAALDPATRPLVDALDRCDCAAAARHYAGLGTVAEPLRAQFDARCRRFGDGCLGR